MNERKHLRKTEASWECVYVCMNEGVDIERCIHAAFFLFPVSKHLNAAACILVIMISIILCRVLYDYEIYNPIIVKHCINKTYVFILSSNMVRTCATLCLVCIQEPTMCQGQV